MRFVAFFSIFLFFTVLAASGSAQLLLNEILADPASDWDGDSTVSSKEDEWVEVINNSSVSIDLSRYRLSDASGGLDWRYAFSGNLGPGEIAVVYGSQVVEWQRANGISTYGLSLNNGGDTVLLYEVFEADTVVIDQYTYASHAVLDDRSVGRKPDGADDWVIFDALNPYTGSKPPPATGCNPSPGSATSCATSMKGSSWGAVKSLYRN